MADVMAILVASCIAEGLACKGPTSSSNCHSAPLLESGRRQVVGRLRASDQHIGLSLSDMRQRQTHSTWEAQHPEPWPTAACCA
jgi:hypothetical protein